MAINLSIPNIRVKSNARYICQICGSTDNIQAHHQIKGDNSSLICLCGECHAKQHINSLHNLITCKKTQQPYWKNKPAGQLARELNAHPRTIYRLAKKYNISKGILSQEAEHIIRTNINLRGVRNKSNEPLVKITVFITHILHEYLNAYRRTSRFSNGFIIRQSLGEFFKKHKIK